MGPRRGGRKITPNLEKEILAKAADGASSRAIAAWMLAERNVKVTHQAIAQLLRHTRQTRAEVAKVVVREKLSKSVITDLERLDREQGRVERITKRLYRLATHSLDTLEKRQKHVAPSETVDSLLETMKEDAPGDEEVHLAAAIAKDCVDAALKSTDRVVKLAALKLKLSGADGSTDTEASDGEDEFQGKLASLASRLAEREGKNGAAEVVHAE